MGYHRIVIHTVGNTDDEVEHVVKTAARALMGHNATVEKVVHNHSGTEHDLTKIATGHDAKNTTGDFWHSYPVDVSTDIKADS